MLRLSSLFLVVAALAALTLSGCMTYTCEGACSQYYGEDGCNMPSELLTQGSTADPLEACTSDCTKAMYNTAVDSGGGETEQGYRNLENQNDAMRFINDVAEQDYSEAAFNTTCEDLKYSGWFQW